MAELQWEVCIDVLSATTRGRAWPLDRRRRYLVGDGQRALRTIATDNCAIATDEEMLAAIYKTGRVSVVRWPNFSAFHSRRRDLGSSALAEQGYLKTRFGWWHLSTWESRK